MAAIKSTMADGSIVYTENGKQYSEADYKNYKERLAGRSSKTEQSSAGGATLKFKGKNVTVRGKDPGATTNQTNPDIKSPETTRSTPAPTPSPMDADYTTTAFAPVLEGEPESMVVKKIKEDKAKASTAGEAVAADATSEEATKDYQGEQMPIFTDSNFSSAFAKGRASGKKVFWWKDPKQGGKLRPIAVKLAEEGTEGDTAKAAAKAPAGEEGKAPQPTPGESPTATGAVPPAQEQQWHPPMQLPEFQGMNVLPEVTVWGDRPQEQDNLLGMSNVSEFQKAKQNKMFSPLMGLANGGLQSGSGKGAVAPPAATGPAGAVNLIYKPEVHGTLEENMYKPVYRPQFDSLGNEIKPKMFPLNNQ